MTTPHSKVLVGPLQQHDRRQALFARLEQVPAHLQQVLRGCYLQPLPVEELAQACRVTPAELSLVRADALRALARTEGSFTAARSGVRSPFL